MWTKVIRSVTFLTDILSHSEYILAISVVFIIVGYVCPIMVKNFGGKCTQYTLFFKYIYKLH